jgi:hypothetical protein
VTTLFGVDCAKVVELNTTKDAITANLHDFMKNPQLIEISVYWGFINSY